MTASAFLSRAYRIDVDINSKLEQITALRSLAEKATNTLSQMPFGGTRNIHRLEDVIVMMLELESEINDCIKALVDTKREIIQAVRNVPTTEHRMLLELRYICGKTWEDIAADMAYSLRSIHRLHAEALQEFEKLTAA